MGSYFSISSQLINLRSNCFRDPQTNNLLLSVCLCLRTRSRGLKGESNEPGNSLLSWLTRPLTGSVSTVPLCFLGSHQDALWNITDSCSAWHLTIEQQSKGREELGADPAHRNGPGGCMSGPGLWESLLLPKWARNRLMSGQPVDLRCFERSLSVPAFHFPFSLLLRPVGLTPDGTVVTWGSLENNQRGSDSSGLGGIWAWIKLKNLPLVIQIHSRMRERGTQARLVHWSVSRLSLSRLLPYHLPSLSLL